MTKNIPQVLFTPDKITSENSDEARELHNKGQFGKLERNKVILSSYDTLYLLQEKKIEIINDKKKSLTEEQFIKLARKTNKEFLLKYAVYKDLKSKNYTVKTALKFGADFRVYEKNVKVGEDHAKWVVFAVKEQQNLNWTEFASKNRVAHSTKKNLLIGVVDDEFDVTYYEIKWLKP